MFITGDTNGNIFLRELSFEDGTILRISEAAGSGQDLDVSQCLVAATGALNANGMFTTVLATCTECGRNEYFNPFNRLCAACPAGFASAGIDPNDITGIILPFLSPCTNCSSETPPASPALVAAAELNCLTLEQALLAPCAPCPPGTVPNNAVDPGEDDPICVPCGAGEYAPTLGSTVCIPCPAGQFSSVNGSIACTPCPRGQFSNDTGSTACQACSAGTFSNIRGATACLQCPPGMTSLIGSTSCTKCPPGTWLLPNGQCTRCPRGKYNPYSGATKCLDCAANTFADEEGSVYCKPCPDGTGCGPGSYVCTPQFSGWGYGGNPDGSWIQWIGPQGANSDHPEL